MILQSPNKLYLLWAFYLNWLRPGELTLCYLNWWHNSLFQNWKDAKGHLWSLSATSSLTTRFLSLKAVQSISSKLFKWDDTLGVLRQLAWFLQSNLDFWDLYILKHFENEIAPFICSIAVPSNRTFCSYEMFPITLSNNIVPSSHTWLLNIWNVAKLDRGT